MESIKDILAFGLIAWLASIAAWTGYLLVSGKIRLLELLTKDCDEHSIVCPERVASLMATLFVAGYLISLCGSLDITPDPETKLITMPDIPESLLVLLATSKSFYLTGKFIR